MSLLVRNRTEDGRLKLSATLAKHLLGYLREPADRLTPEDRELKLVLRVFTDWWAKQERAAWGALAFRESRRGRRQTPVRVEDRRRQAPQAREARPVRRARTAGARGSPSSSQSDDDDPHEHELGALPGFRAASERMFVHVGRRLAAARVV
jgi:hypothetical protein